MHEYLRKMLDINKLGSTLRELACKLLEPLTCSEIVVDVVLISVNMISTARCNYQVPMSDLRTCTVRYVLINAARELTECVVYDKLYTNADSLIAINGRFPNITGHLGVWITS